MAWQFKDGTPYSGDTHILAGIVYSGRTRTPSSRTLVEVSARPTAKKVQRSTGPQKAKKKPAPKAKGATAWD